MRVRIVACAVVLVIVAWIVANIFFLSPAVTNNLEAFGPWESSADVLWKRKNIVLLQEDGSKLVSQKWGVKFSPPGKHGWMQVMPMEISSISVDGLVVTMTTNKGVSFQLGAGQPFIFAQTPSMVYLIDWEGGVWSVSTAKVKKTITK